MQVCMYPIQEFSNNAVPFASRCVLVTEKAIRNFVNLEVKVQHSGDIIENVDGKTVKPVVPCLVVIHKSKRRRLQNQHHWICYNAKGTASVCLYLWGWDWKTRKHRLEAGSIAAKFRDREQKAWIWRRTLEGRVYLTTEHSLDSQATWVIDVLGLLFFDMLFMGVSQPGTGRRLVDRCRNYMSVLLVYLSIHLSI